VSLPGRVRRTLAVALLPASILPVFVLGPGIVRAPEHALRGTLAALDRLEQGSAPGR
jgi:hypothetical protein